MARLNDPPPPIESVDALKRRFVRQNRELTKANTTQSLRIRTLELETSRLLSENLTLRSQIIKLQHSSQQHLTRHAAISAVKDKLETQLAELGKLVCELGDAQDNNGVGTAYGDGGIGGDSARVCEAPPRSPDQKNWKNALTLSEVAGGGAPDAGRLPVILEDKCYPRRTMNADELLHILSLPPSTNATDSPDLGPPPIAHFDAEDPIRFDASSKASNNNGHGSGEPIADVSEDGMTVLSANLETRKKRKEGGDSNSTSNSLDLGAGAGAGAAQREDSSSGPNGQLPLTASALAREDPLQTSQHHLNPGAKRKLSAREDEESTSEPTVVVITEDGKDEFNFNRRHGTRIGVDGRARESSVAARQEAKTSSTKITEDLAAARGTSTNRGRARDGTAGVRRALEPKSANTDPVSSPVKTSTSTSKAGLSDKITEVKKEAVKKARERDRDRYHRDSKKSAVIDIRPPEPTKQEAETEEAQPNEAADLPPETPASLDLFSPPPSSEPSAVRPESRDTPPPSDLNPLAATGDAFNAAGRATRRPRAGVSYAEPNLRDKMRRPTKALADAVGAEERIQRAAAGIKVESSDSLPTAADGMNTKLRTVVIKKENVSEPAWKHLPSESSQNQNYRAGATSPLGDRPRSINGGDLPPSVMTERRHRVSSIHNKPEEPSDGGEKHTSAAGTAIAALVAGTRKPKGTDSGKDEENLDEAMDKLEIYDFHGSSPADDEGTNAVNGGVIASRSSRRHSSVPSSSRHCVQQPSILEVAKEDVGSAARPRPSSRSTGRRRGTLGLDTTPVESSEEPPSNHVLNALTQAKSMAELKDVSDVTGRAERAASRRRSMML